MKRSLFFRISRIGLSAVVIGLFLLFNSCGGGGGSSAPGGGGGSQSSPGLFITDHFNDDFRQVLVTIYKVEFVESGGAVQTVFVDEKGAAYDLRHLSGVLSPLAAGVPAGSYSAVRITVADRLILVDNSGTSFNPTFAQTPSTTCGVGRCVIAIDRPFTVSADHPVVLDFDLKQFTFDQAANTVTASVVLDEDGSGHGGYAEERDDNFELKGVVQTLRADGFDLAVFHAKSFTPPDYTAAVTVNAETAYGCDPDDPLPQCGIASLAEIKTGMVVKMNGLWSNGAFTATEVKVDADGDVNTARLACAVPDRSHAAFQPTGTMGSIVSDSYTFNPADFSITVGEKTILIVKETFIRLRTADTDQVICADAIPAGPGRV